MLDNICSLLYAHALYHKVIGFLFVSGFLYGCAIGDDDQSACRCSPASNVVLFPECADSTKATYKESSNPFATQIPECPSGKQLFLLQRTRPEYALNNLRIIFSASPESRSPDQYMEQLTEDFTFIPDEEDIRNHPDVYQSGKEPIWGTEQERDFARAILDPERIGAVRFVRWFQSTLDERIPSEDQLRETFIFPYELELSEISTDDASGTGTLIGIKGFMEVDFVTPTVENPVWNISQWRDQRDRASAKFSWGELRALFKR